MARSDLILSVSLPRTRVTQLAAAVSLALVAPMLVSCDRQPRIGPLPQASVELAIAASVYDIPEQEVAALRAQLQEDSATLSDLSPLRWFPVGDLGKWPTYGSQASDLAADPQAFFTQQGLIIAEHNDRWHLLLRIDSSSMIRGTTPPPWSVLSAHTTVDNVGRPTVAFILDGSGAQRLKRLTSAAVGSHLAIIVDGEVYCAPTLRSSLSKGLMILGNYTPSQAANIVRQLTGHPILSK